MGCSYLNETKNIRLFLHDNFYSKGEIISQISEYIPLCFDVFSINYQPETQSFKIKIKKTNMKKNDSNYMHNTTYYYQVINTIFCNIFNSNIVLLQNLMATNAEKYNLHMNDINYLLDRNLVSGVYNVTTLLDNVIVISL